MTVRYDSEPDLNAIARMWRVLDYFKMRYRRRHAGTPMLDLLPYKAYRLHRTWRHRYRPCRPIDEAEARFRQFANLTRDAQQAWYHWAKQ